MSTAQRKKVSLERSRGKKGVGAVGSQLVEAGLEFAAAAAVEAWVKRGKKSVVARALQAAAPTASGIQVAAGAQVQRVILLPGPSGLRSTSRATANFLGAMNTFGAATAVRAVGGPPVKMKVVDSIHEDGAKLVETTAEDLQKLRVASPGLVVVPERFFDLAVVIHRVEQSAISLAGGVNALRSIAIKLKSVDGAPIAGATVVAFTDFAGRVGAQGVSSSKGTLALRLPSSVKKLDRLYVYPEATYWGTLGTGVALPASGVLALTLEPIDLGAPDALRHFAGAGQLTDGEGVNVAVIDTGIALNHPDLRVLGGECTVSGENASAFGPFGGDHGSHCAGIIAARGSAPTGIRGVAPAAALYSFRVFPKPTAAKPHPGASNFAIAKAIDRAVAAGCDLINLSLGGGPSDRATEAAIEAAYSAGVVCIVAAGNDERQPVAFPASYDLSVAVSAIGRKDLFPLNSVFAGDVARPFGDDRKNFVASFSNMGSDLDLTGPGVAIVSTVPRRGYAAMSGTSMATPAVVGLAARMLAKKKRLLNASRDQRRAAEIVRTLLLSAQRLGFAANFVGQGLPR